MNRYIVHTYYICFFLLALSSFYIVILSALRYFSQKQRNLIDAKPCTSHCGIQTDFIDFNPSLSHDWNVSHDCVESLSIVDRVKRVAESALLQTGFVYEQTSGMYYDYNTGYYYDAVRIAMYISF